MFTLKVVRKCLLNNRKDFWQPLGRLSFSTLKEGANKPPLCIKAFGQPTHDTHPHLIGKNEITPLIEKGEYQARRERLIESIISYDKGRNADVRNYIVVIPSATKQYMSNKIPYVFRQNTEFLYLTGCQEPDSCLVITADSSGQLCSTLFMREKDEHSELWDGPRTGPENTPSFFGVEQGLPVTELESYIKSYLNTSKQYSLWFDYTAPLQSSVHKIMNSFLGALAQKLWESPKALIHRLQLIKSPAEIALMQKSCEVASRAIEKTIEFSRPGMSEHDIFAKVDYESRIRGANFLAYPPVVAGGSRATVIHYINNNQIVEPGDMVLLDAGCEYHGYTSDITRTWPISGKFSTEQKILYEIVLATQKKLINLCSDLPPLDSLFDSMCFFLGKSLQEVGIINQGTPKAVMKVYFHQAAYQFCPHHVSHYLGMDVHDTPTITRNIDLKPGMVITIEPGIYINDKQKNVPPQFRGIGIRIEDDVLMTENGPVVLTKNCPKSIEDIERIASRYQS